MSENKPKSQKEPQFEAETLEKEEKTEIVESFPRIQRKNATSKYVKEFEAIPPGKYLKVLGGKEISRYFSALTRLQDQGKFSDLEAHQRTIDGEIHGYIGRKEDFS
jgi:hypothetical protein